ncbi:MAG: PepSY domain-containing protein [Paracoccus sp. (in: a-proteobacteria)]|nr:PepSY domain-containing protein [Paracoccus sp. (in: a-proteobacteria)]
MKRKIVTLMGTAMLSAAALTGGIAWAGSSDDKAESALLQNAPHDIAAAIRAAETASGGKAVAAEFEEKDGKGYYEIDLVAHDKLVEVKIDAATGQATETKDKGALSAQKDDDYVDPAQLGGALTDLVAKAETEGAGKVMAIGLEHEDGKAVGLEVELVKADGSVHDFILNPADGKLTPVVGNQDDDGQGEDNEAGENNG